MIWRKPLPLQFLRVPNAPEPSNTESHPLSTRSYLNSPQKRVLDATGALTLLFLLAPLLLLVALIIKSTSQGPVIFRQKRCGAGGKPFEIWKFRSMYMTADTDHVVQATRGDPRVTPVGRFIRRTSIDELPQLVNVLRGHMSLIGPRPHALSHDIYFGGQIDRYSDRFAARPGLSGLAQVRGARGETPEVADMERRIALDLIYIHHASLGMDVRIIAETVQEMLVSRTAY